MSEHRDDHGPGGRPDEVRGPDSRYGRGRTGRGRDERGASWAGRDERGAPWAGRDHEHGQHGQHQQHGGYGTVNGASGPENDPNQRGQDAQDLPQDFPQHTAQHSPQAELGPDELALRRMMRGAVQDIAPSDDALAHLRRAVPARRARKRQAVVGMAAAALLIGTAVPALFHVASSPASDDNLTSAGDSSSVPGEDGSDEGAGSVGGGGDKEPGKDGEKEKDEKEKGETDKGETESGGATVGTSPSGEVIANAPVCDASMLGSPTATTGAAHPDGTVYGAFTVSNQSTVDCTVGGSGSVTRTAQGAASDSRISVADHAAGDPASGLPAPSTEPSVVVLKPGQAYQVQFAWVPSDSCPSVEPSPDPSPSGDNADSGGSGQTGSELETQLATDEGGTQDGSVLLTHTAEPGAPTVDVTIPDACAGTIYKTEAMPAS
ncbi:hypothetical protein [Streptomyces sp. N35]|uniref:hypothetical protein n=1 Tax=Streptomyces sp. N35 TaxID=2795730 RepID=UPI001F23D932|nr:hypothetical protein [Streptomyces sp. N35]